MARDLAKYRGLIAERVSAPQITHNPSTSSMTSDNICHIKSRGVGSDCPADSKARVVNNLPISAAALESLQCYLKELATRKVSDMLDFHNCRVKFPRVVGKKMRVHNPKKRKKRAH